MFFLIVTCCHVLLTTKCVCFCIFCAPVSTFVFLAYPLQVFLICILWGTRESEVVLCILLVLRKEMQTATCYFGYDVLSHLVLLTTESVDFCKTFSKAVEHHWALLTGQSLPASFVVVHCWWILEHRLSCILHMNIFKDLDLTPNCLIFPIFSRYKFVCKIIPPVRCVRTVHHTRWTDPTCSREHHCLGCTSSHTPPCTSSDYGNILLHKCCRIISIFSTHATTLACIATIHANCVVACHCILLHVGILHVSYFS